MLDNCTRCGDDILAKHPIAWMIVDVQAPLLEGNLHGGDRSVLCAECMLKLGEFLVPALKDDGEWISGQDQLKATLRDIRHE